MGSKKEKPVYTQTTVQSKIVAAAFRASSLAAFFTCRETPGPRELLAIVVLFERSPFTFWTVIHRLQEHFFELRIFVVSLFFWSLSGFSVFLRLVRLIRTTALGCHDIPRQLSYFS